jgi:23S rRNA (adenine2503-C2)-methyltransferase
MESKPAITDLTLPELEEALESLGEKKWRAQQILKWVYRRRAQSFAEMTDLSESLRTSLDERFRIFRSKVAHHHKSADGTEKMLLELDGGDTIEGVLIRDQVTTKTGGTRERTTVCVSTQVGCPMACVFCASGMNGLKRNLSPGEIVEQVLHTQRLLPEETRISNVVLMGIGEPLLNYLAVVQALRSWKAAWGCGIGFNRVTLSTVGVYRRLKNLVAMKATPNLAISLHAPNDAVRDEVVPAMKKIDVEKIIRAGIKYKKKTGKDVTFEYVLLDGINDAPEHARELGERLAGTQCKVNVIPFNPVEELPYREPSQERLDRFVEELGACGVPVLVRKRKGDKVSAACGQLRAKWTKKKAMSHG